MAEVLGTGVKKICGPVKVSIRLHPPDAKRRDLDNIFKPLMDALMFAAVIEDDSNVKWIDAKFLGKVAGGRVDVCVESIEDFKYL